MESAPTRDYVVSRGWPHLTWVTVTHDSIPVTGCLRPTTTDNLPILAGIQPAELCRSGANKLSPARRAMEPGHLFHSALTGPSSANAQDLKSRHPFAPPEQHLIRSSDNDKKRAAQWAVHQWNAVWTDNTTKLRIFILDTGTHPPGSDPPKKCVGPA